MPAAGAAYAAGRCRPRHITGPPARPFVLRYRLLGTIQVGDCATISPTRSSASAGGGKAGPLKNFFDHLLKRIGAENFPPVLLAEAALLLGAHRAGRQLSGLESSVRGASPQQDADCDSGIARATRDTRRLQKPGAFLWRYVKFESISLQQRVNKLSLPEKAIAREEAAVALTSRS